VTPEPPSRGRPDVQFTNLLIVMAVGSSRARGET
jgi:hypothetical protein